MQTLSTPTKIDESDCLADLAMRSVPHAVAGGCIPLAGTF